MSKRIQAVIDEIIDQYLYDENTTRLWIIGFSGGKDSTVLLMLVWKALEQIKELSGVVNRDIYVVCNDTLIENPVITEYVFRVLNDIEDASVKEGMPIKVRKTSPKLEESFWVNLIGRGYPAPNNSFRWCTDRLKIRPTSRFILEQVDEKGEAIILIGTRSDESASRARSIKKHHRKGNRLRRHPNHHNTYIYAPIKDLMLEEVWYLINTMGSPWGSSNEELYQIYADASADDYECPTMVSNKNHQSCGQSRFGCWTCTVVKQDKSMSAQIDSGREWLRPLLEFRDQLAEERNDPDTREPFLRNGAKAKNEMGTLKPSYKASVLRRLLQVQKSIQEHNPELKLISNQELVAIQVLWYRDLNFDFKVSTIFNEIYHSELDMKNQDSRIQKEEELLKESCKSNPDDFSLIQDLLSLQKTKTLLIRKRGLQSDIERRISNFIYQKDSKLRAYI